VAPALAAAETEGRSGKDLLLGIVAGYEVQVRLRDAIGGRGREGWDGTSTTAQYSAAAAAGKLLGLDAGKLANALAIAGSNASTLAEVRRGAELTPAKGSAEPMAARNGTFAALLARAGLSYPLTILEGEGGYGKMVSGPLNEEMLRKRSGDFEILKSSIKLWPCVGTAQAPIAAAANVYRQKAVNDIAAITVSLNYFAYEQQQALPKKSIRENTPITACGICGADAAGRNGDRGRFRGKPFPRSARAGADPEDDVRADPSLPDMRSGRSSR
jgi:2-methylcitrate dehydratase